MKVKVKFFAQHREAVGKSEIELNIEKTEGTTVARLYEALVAKYPGLAKLSRITLAVVNYNMVNEWEMVKDGDEVAFFPPMGGA